MYEGEYKDNKEHGKGKAFYRPLTMPCDDDDDDDDDNDEYTNLCLSSLLPAASIHILHILTTPPYVSHCM